MTYEQILEKFKEEGINKKGIAYGDYRNIPEIGPSEEVDCYGGEDCGTEWYTVWYFKDHDVYIKVDAEYYSYEGVDFDGAVVSQVFPTKVTRIEYLPVKQ